MNTAYDKLCEIIDDIDNLIEHHVTEDAPAFQAWYTKTKRFLLKQYGEKSVELQAFNNTYFSLGCYTFDTPNSEFIKACKEGLTTTKLTFEEYKSDFEGTGIKEDQAYNNEKHDDHNNFSKVFIVHGHDVALKEAVARLVERQGIEPIILNEQANRGKTIIEKLEEYSEVAGAVCLFTTDDEGKEIHESELKKRARQNVVFEAGYFMALLGRSNVVMLAADGVDIPSDLSGVLYTSVTEWKFALLKEMKAMGYTIDYNKLD